MTKQLTREQVLEMSEQELAEATAVHVMGWKDGHTLQIYRDMGICERLVHNEFIGAAIWERWNPAGDIKDVWEVADKFYFVDIRKVNKVDEDRRWQWIAYLGGGDGYSHNATADTAPEAICKASLLAVMGL